MSKSDIRNNIIDYFFDLPYSEHYSADITFTIIVTLIVLLICIFLYIKSFIESYRSKWYKYKCHPFLIPFAATVNPQGSKSKDMDYTYNNFKECLDQFLEEMMYHVKQPMKSTVDTFVSIVRNIFFYLKKVIEMIVVAIISVFDVLRNLLRRLGLFVSEIGILSANILAFFGKILSIITSIFYSVIAVVKLLKLFFTIFAIGVYAATVVPTIITFGVAAAIFVAILIAGGVFPPFTIPIWIGLAFSGLVMIVSGGFLVIFILIHGVVDEFAIDVNKFSQQSQQPKDPETGGEITPYQYYANKCNISFVDFDSLSQEEKEKKMNSVLIGLFQDYQNLPKDEKKIFMIIKPNDLPIGVWDSVRNLIDDINQ